MLREIESIPDPPALGYSRSPPVPRRSTTTTKFSTITTTSTSQRTPSSLASPPSPTSAILSVNGTRQALPSTSTSTPSWITENVFTDDEDGVPYHARKTSAPFTYGLTSDSPAIQRRRRFLSDSAHPVTGFRRGEDDPLLRDLSLSPEPGRQSDENSLTWLQRHQQKLKARKEGRGWEDRQQIEHQLIQELRSSTHTRKGEDVLDGLSSPSHEVEGDKTGGLLTDVSASSRENSPSKVSFFVSDQI